MKAIIISLSLYMAAMPAVRAQKINAADVPAAVKEAFSKQYPGLTPEWEKEDGNYEAGFKSNGHEISAVFTPDGGLTETEEEINITALPAAATAYITKNYKGATIKEAAKITKSGGEINYEAAIKETALIFDNRGIFIRKEKD